MMIYDLKFMIYFLKIAAKVVKKMQMRKKIGKKVVNYVIFVVISARPFPFGAGSLRKYVRVLRDICKPRIFFVYRSFRRL